VWLPVSGVDCCAKFSRLLLQLSWLLLKLLHGLLSRSSGLEKALPDKRMMAILIWKQGADVVNCVKTFSRKMAKMMLILTQHTAIHAYT
jgi:hypothetical protein